MIKKIKLGVSSFYKKTIFSLAALNNPLFIGYYKYFYKPSRGSLSWYLDKFSSSKKDITVIQVGANDGFFHDPLLKFIKRDKWNGVLIEPQKYVLETFLKKLHRKSPGIIPLNAALDKEDGTRNLYTISFSNARWATGIASFNWKVVEERVESGHVFRRAKKEGDKLPARKEDYITSINVRTISPKTLIKEFKIKKVDILAVDTEGYDFEILKIFDLKKIKPRMIIFEHSHIDQESMKECDQYLIKNGYTFKRLEADTIAFFQLSPGEFEFVNS